jgi:hypothetical protein
LQRVRGKAGGGATWRHARYTSKTWHFILNVSLSSYWEMPGSLRWLVADGQIIFWPVSVGTVICVKILLVVPDTVASLTSAAVSGGAWYSNIVIYPIFCFPEQVFVLEHIQTPGCSSYAVCLQWTSVCTTA